MIIGQTNKPGEILELFWGQIGVTPPYHQQNSDFGAILLCILFFCNRPKSRIWFPIRRTSGMALLPGGGGWVLFFWGKLGPTPSPKLIISSGPLYWPKSWIRAWRPEGPKAQVMGGGYFWSAGPALFIKGIWFIALFWAALIFHWVQLRDRENQSQGTTEQGYRGDSENKILLLLHDCSVSERASVLCMTADSSLWMSRQQK